MQIRPAVPADAAGISDFLQELVALGKRSLPADADWVLNSYIQGPDLVRCSVAEEVDGTLIGVQILFQSQTENAYGTPAGWGGIGTHVRPSAAGRGVGRALFSATLEAAKAAGITDMNASIGDDNDEGLGYYEAMGFRTFKTLPGRICKRYSLAG